jgi:hypothetical protein
LKRLFLLFWLAAGLLPAETVTFNKRIAPIVYNNCSWCHRPGEATPFSLLSYQDVLVGVPHDESDLPLLRRDLLRPRKKMARTRMMADPDLRRKVAELLAQ